MILSAHQPAYLPWSGYLNKIASVDVFIYLDKVQYEKNSFINRNKIKTPQGSQWLTVPIKIKGHINNSILKTKIDNTFSWQEKHLKSIQMNYSRAHRYKECFYKIEKLVNIKENNLAEFGFEHLKFWLEELNIKTKIYRLSDLPIINNKSNLILDLCRYFGAKKYLSGPFGRNYLNEDEFSNSGIIIEYQNYIQKIYNQLWGDFIPNLSFLDIWFNFSDYKLIIK